MLEEIIRAYKPLKKSKLLKAALEMTAQLPTVESKISFLPLINYLKENGAVVSGTRAGFYKYLIERFESQPALLRPIENIQLLKDHDDLLELLETTLFPVVGEHEKNGFALAAPYQFTIFYYSDCFRELFLEGQEDHLLLPAGTPWQEMKEIHCSMIYDHILEKFYGIRLNIKPDLIYPVTDAKTGLKKYYRIRYDSRFIDVHLKGSLPLIQDCAVCLNTFRILDLEKQLTTMPLELFEMEGFAVWVAEDVTVAESLDRIKKILLRPDAGDAGIISELKAAIKTLAALNDVEVGLMPFVRINDRFVLEENYTCHSLVGKKWRSNDAVSLGMFYDFVEFVKNMPERMPISNLDEDMFQIAPFVKPVFDSGFRSFVYYPLQNSEGILGMLEIASPVSHLLTHEVMSRIEPAIPLLSVALLKIRDTFNNDIEKLIKEKFTALQPCVEWKFAEVAWSFKNENGDQKDSSNVIFDQVYPLYGAIDIRNSSMERSQAIQKDMIGRLYLIDDILEQLLALVPLPLLDGLKFKNQNILQSIRETITSDDEMKITEFLEVEVEPVFSHLQKGNSRANEIVQGYLKMVKNTDSHLYKNRRAYEESMATINDVALNYIEKQEDMIQLTYPHYFEKYRTDGVEYNIYIGQSIAPHYPFDLLYLKNIRLWQLKSMAELARITHRLLPDLKVPLQTTQLILIHSQCISIHFRRDERRFDVEGSYNIRYEIMKKRIDKARVRHTQERLTQPGTIAMVYSSQKEVLEYEEYITFLQNKNILKPGIQYLELEEMQGLRGLKAIRVEIDMDD